MNNAMFDGSIEEVPGATLLDGFLQSFFLGLLFAQATKYWADFRDDSWRKRVFVAVVVVLSILQTILEDYKVWRVTILHQKWATSVMQWCDLFLNGCICSLCAAFFIRRCWKMTNKSPWVLYPLSLLSMTVIVANLYLAIEMATHSLEFGLTDDRLKVSRHALPSTIIAFSYWIFGSLVLDIIVTLILVVSLWRAKTGLTEVDQVVSHIITITWESAALPSISMVVAVALYHGDPRSAYHLVVFFVLLTGKLYTLGLLRTLNSRVQLRQRMGSHDLGRTSLSDWQWEQEPTSISGNPDVLCRPSRTFNSSETFRSFDLLSQPTTQPVFHPEGISPHDNSNGHPLDTSRVGEMTHASENQFGTPCMNARERAVQELPVPLL